MQDNNDQVGNAIVCGLNTLSDPEIRVPARDTELLSTFKGILKALINGELILITPDQLKQEEPPVDPSADDTTE